MYYIRRTSVATIIATIKEKCDCSNKMYICIYSLYYDDFSNLDYAAKIGRSIIVLFLSVFMYVCIYACIMGVYNII